MPRNRMIKPEFFESETLMRVSLESQLTFIGIWCHCDDFGCCMANARRLLGQIYPLRDDVTEKKMKDWLLELVTHKLIVPFDYEGKKLFIVRNWFEHQRVQHPSKRRYVKDADFESVITHSIESHETFMKDYVESHAPKRKKKEKEESETESGKTAYADNVHMLPSQYKKLLEKAGSERGRDWCVEKLNAHKNAKGQTYKCDYSAMISWVLGAMQEAKAKSERLAGRGVTPVQNLKKLPTQEEYEAQDDVTQDAEGNDIMPWNKSKS